MCAHNPCRRPRDDLPALVLPGGPGFGESGTCLRVSDKSFWGSGELGAAPRLSFAGAGVGEEKDYSAAWVGQRASVVRKRRPSARASLGHIVPLRPVLAPALVTMAAQAAAGSTQGQV